MLFCDIPLTSNSSDYVTFFEYLAFKMEHILTNFPFAETSILGDFNVHNQLWLSSSVNDQSGEQAFNFAIRHDLKQLVQHHTYIPDRSDDTPNILDLFLTNPYLLLPITLSNCPLRWAPPIVLFQYLVLSLQCRLMIHRSRGAFGIMPWISGMIWGCTILIFHGLITVSMLNA